MKSLNTNQNSNIQKVTSTELINIYKNTSLPRSKKGCYQLLHVLEPLGIEFINYNKINIIIEGKDISGFATVYIHNTDDIKKIQTIRVGAKRSVNISILGELFLDIDQVIYKPNNDIKFNFIVKLEIDSNSYIINPVFDIRANKISTKIIDDEIIFKQKLHSFENKEHGMIMISDNVRMYMPKSKYIPMYFSPIELLELYEKIIVSYNNLAGFDYQSSDELLQPRKQFILISARNNHLEFASAGSTMMDTAPSTCRFYFNDGWGLFHEFAHLFEGFWSIAEIWTNMYSKYMAERSPDGFVWLWQGVWGIDREKFEKFDIKNLYEKYLIDKDYFISKLTPKIGLYFFITLEEALGDNFVPILERYAKKNPPSIIRMEYLVYAISKNYNVNIIPYAEIYGQKIDNQNLIDEIIDNSKSSLLYIPKNDIFDTYRNISIPVTIKKIYNKDKIIQGISNSNSIIKIKIKNVIYNIQTDNDGKFKFKIPISLNLKDQIVITSKEIGKDESMPKKFYLSNGLSNNTISFIGANKVLVAKIDFDIKNRSFLISSTGKKPNVTIINKEYFKIFLQDINGNVKFKASVKSDQSAANFKLAVENQYFEYNDILILTSISVNDIAITNYGGEKIYYNKLNVEKFKITKNGLIPN